MGFEHGRCKSCRHWQSGRPPLGRCVHPKMAPARRADVEDCLVVVPAPRDGVRTGARFGCIHWELAEEVADCGGLSILSAEDLKALLAKRGMKPSELAAKLGVKRQRVSDWLTGHRDVPVLAVTALRAMGLLDDAKG